MKIKTFRRRLSVAVILICGLVLLVFTQVPAQSQNSSKVPSHTIEIVSQPDSPLALTAKGSEKADYGLLKLNVGIKNIGEKTIRAFSLSRNAFEPTARNLQTFFAPLNSGQTIEAFDHEALVNLKEGSKVYFLIDYVLFTDGTSWGKNSRNESDFISGYRNAQEKVIAEIRAFIDRKNENGLSEYFDKDNYEIDPSLIDQTKPQKWQSGFASGYKFSFYRLKDQYRQHGIEGLPATVEIFNEMLKPSLIGG